MGRAQIRFDRFQDLLEIFFDLPVFESEDSQTLCF